MVLSADHWNRCRHPAPDRGGHYESYFQRANHPHRPLAFWIRYTVFSPQGRPDDAVGELWAIYFDGERHRITAAKQVIPFRECQLSADRLDVRMGNAILSNGHVSGSASAGVNTLQWHLGYSDGQPPLLLLPPALYERSFPKAKAVVGTPHAIFNGNLVVNGEVIVITDWVGSQNHNWGRKHTDAYAWGQVVGFDNAPEAFLECATARLKIGPFWSPPLTVIVLRLEGREIRLNSIPQAIRAQANFDASSWRFESANANARITAHIHAPTTAMAGLVYHNPPGGSKTCLNSKLATCELTLERPGQSTRTLFTRNRAAFELLTDRTDHGVSILA